MSLSDVQVEKGGKTFAAAINVVAEAEDVPVCWICLDGPQPDKPLMHPCRCPSFCHAACIARWQLQSAGTRREKYCDFCNFVLPDWKEILTPRSGATAPAVMNVNFDNRTYSFQVSPGADGYRQFTEAIRKAFHLPDDSELNITFTCDEPSSGALLTLSGPGAYDAAVHCASVSAARRSSCSGDELSSPTSSPLPSPGDALGPAPTLPAVEGGEGAAPVSSNAGSGMARTGAAAAGAVDGSQAAALHHSASFHSTTSSGPGEQAAGAGSQHQPASHNILQSSSSLSTSSSSLTLPAAAAQQQDQQQQQHGAAAGGSGCTSPAASSPHSCSELGWCAGSNASTGMCHPSDASAAGSSSSSSSSSRRTSAQGGSSASPSASASDSEGSQHDSNAAAAATAAAAAGGGSGGSRLQRRGSVGLGRKLRSALSDLLVMK